MVDCYQILKKTVIICIPVPILVINNKESKYFCLYVCTIHISHISDYIRTFTWDKKLETILKSQFGGQGTVMVSI